MTTPDNGKVEQKNNLDRYKKIALEKLDCLNHAQIEFDGFSSCYRKLLKQFIISSFVGKYGEIDGWIKIESNNHPELNGVYSYEIDDLVTEEYNYPRSIISRLNLWVKVKPLVLTKDGFIAKYIQNRLLSIEFLLMPTAFPCDKPKFKERSIKKVTK